MREPLRRDGPGGRTSPAHPPAAAPFLFAHTAVIGFKNQWFHLPNLRCFYPIGSQAVELIGMAMATDPSSTLTDGSCIKIVGGEMTKLAVTRALAQAKVDVKDVKVVELHDCFSANEVRPSASLLVDSGVLFGLGGMYSSRSNSSKMSAHVDVFHHFYPSSSCRKRGAQT